MKTPILSITLLSFGVSAVGAVSTATITLNKATTVPLVLSLCSSDPTNASVPTKVTVPAGARTVTVPLTVPSGYSGAPEAVTLTATGRGTSVTSMVTIKGLLLSRTSVSPASLRGGLANATLTITLNAKVGADVTVALNSDSSSATVPATVVIPAESSSAIVTVTTRTVPVRAFAHLKASLNGSSLSTSRTVNP